MIRLLADRIAARILDYLEARGAGRVYGLDRQVVFVHPELSGYAVPVYRHQCFEVREWEVPEALDRLSREGWEILALVHTNRWRGDAAHSHFGERLEAVCRLPLFEERRQDGPGTDAAPGA